jgi:hypothetical protein
MVMDVPGPPIMGSSAMAGWLWSMCGIQAERTPPAIKMNLIHIPGQSTCFVVISFALDFTFMRADLHHSRGRS